MKSYQRVLNRVLWVALIIGLITGAGFGIAQLSKSADAREVRASWCLSAGGRTVEVDRVRGCFELTLVDIHIDDCGKDPKTVFLHRVGRAHIDQCYTFKLILEN